MSVQVQEGPLPADFGMGFVVAEAMRTVGDTVMDVDRHPGVIGAKGTVTFSPHIKNRKITGAVSAFVAHENVTARFVDGVLVDVNDQPGIYLVAGVYRVTFNLDFGTISPFDVEVTTAHTEQDPLDLVQAAPYTYPPNVVVTQLQVVQLSLEEYLLLVSTNSVDDNTFYMVHSD